MLIVLLIFMVGMSVEYNRNGEPHYIRGKGDYAFKKVVIIPIYLVMFIIKIASKEENNNLTLINYFDVKLLCII